MKITVLGSWGGFPYQNEGTSSYLLEADGFHLLLDAGSNTLSVLQQHFDPLRLDAVILSHYHHDHIADLGVLFYQRQLMPTDLEVPELPVFGHLEDQKHFEELTMPGIAKGVGYQEQDTLELGPFVINFIKTVHPVPCFAMRIVEKKTGKCFVFSADSGYFEAFAPFAKDADLLMMDTYLFEGSEKHHAHFTAKEAGEIAVLAGAKRLVLTHLPQEADLELLKMQAEKYAGTIPVSLARPHQVYMI